MEKIGKVEDIHSIPLKALDQAEAEELLQWLDTDGEVMDAYFDRVRGIVLAKEIINKQGKDLKIVFTPLHGTTSKPLRKALELAGFDNIIVVKEQEMPDPDFSTVSYPNPEDPDAFTIALEYAEREGADLIIGTDPDGDRLGIFARDRKHQFVPLTGNQTGAILLNYILKQRRQMGILPDNGIVIKTIVTSEFGRAIASYYGVETEDTLTGFKYIGERIERYTQTGEKVFLFGYEESYGYLIEGFSRDKDGIQASVMAAEAAAYYREQGKTLVDALEELYEQFGYYREDLVTISLEGIRGIQQMNRIMDVFRHSPIEKLGDAGAIGGTEAEVVEIVDYLNGATGLPISDVVRYRLEDESWFCVRPSGTEPKIKFYFAVKGESRQRAIDKIEALKRAVMSICDQCLSAE